MSHFGFSLPGAGSTSQSGFAGPVRGLSPQLSSFGGGSLRQPPVVLPFGPKALRFALSLLRVLESSSATRFLCTSLGTLVFPSASGLRHAFRLAPLPTRGLSARPDWAAPPLCHANWHNATRPHLPWPLDCGPGNRGSPRKSEGACSFQGGQTRRTVSCGQGSQPSRLWPSRHLPPNPGSNRAPHAGPRAGGPGLSAETGWRVSPPYGDPGA